MCKNCPKRKEYCGGLRFEGADYHNCPSFDKVEITDKELWRRIESGEGLPPLED